MCVCVCVGGGGGGGGGGEKEMGDCEETGIVRKGFRVLFHPTSKSVCHLPSTILLPKDSALNPANTTLQGKCISLVIEFTSYTFLALGSLTCALLLSWHRPAWRLLAKERLACR